MSEHESKVSPNKDSEAPAAESINLGRRRLSKAALAVPVVVASLSARPAMACSVSGFISGNASPGRTPPTCEGYGCTPGFWKNNPWIWEKVTPLYDGGQCSDPTSFPRCAKTWVIGGSTLAQILPSSCGNPFAVSSGEFLLAIFLKGMAGNSIKSGYADVCHYMAAILNAAATPAYGSTVEEIQAGLCKAIENNEVNHYTTVLLARLNERGCVYDAHGACEGSFVKNEDGQCIPACPEGYEFNKDSVSCVPKTTTP